MRVITLTTDFGLADWFVGAMKGTILGIEPSTTIVDITHDIPAGDIRAGAFALFASFRSFPKETVHVAVVDPGVGSSRSSLAVQTKDYFFVGPDNGLLSLALAQESVQAAHRLENKRFFAESISNTFHGRDIFAPVAAHLSKGAPLAELGPELRSYQQLQWPAPKLGTDQLRGEIIYFDRFGNALTNVRATDLSNFDPQHLKITVAHRKRACHFGQFYQQVEKGRPVALIGSSGFLEIAVNGGNAAKQLRLKIGDPVIIRAAP